MRFYTSEALWSLDRCCLTDIDSIMTLLIPAAAECCLMSLEMSNLIHISTQAYLESGWGHRDTHLYPLSTNTFFLTPIDMQVQFQHIGCGQRKISTTAGRCIPSL